MLFTKSRTQLSKQFSQLARLLAPAGMLWVSWPKKSSGVATDLTENEVRAIGLGAGLVDVKVCAGYGDLVGAEICAAREGSPDDRFARRLKCKQKPSVTGHLDRPEGSGSQLFPCEKSRAWLPAKEPVSSGRLASARMSHAVLAPISKCAMKETIANSSSGWISKLATWKSRKHRTHTKSSNIAITRNGPNLIRSS